MQNKPTQQNKPTHLKKRALTKRQLRALRRKRRRERFCAILLILCAIAACVVAGAMISRPKKDESAEQIASIMASITASPTPEVTDAPTPAPTDAPEGVESDVVVPDAAVVPDEAQPSVEAEATNIAPAELRSVHFRVTGDIMCTENQLEYAKIAGGGNGYTFHPQFALIYESLAAADYTMGNLETTIGLYNNKPYSGYPMFNSPETLLQAMKDSGYDLLTLANNHMLDRWFDGMKNTVANVEAYGFEHIGAYRTREERQAAKVIEINGIRFGFLAYTEYANRMEKHSDEGATLYGVPFLETADIEGDIKRLREAGAEVVVVFAHWGAEYRRSPDSTQQKYAQIMANAGADIILGGHPHVLQPMGYVDVPTEDGGAREVFIAFSLGNFLSSQHVQDYTDTGMILDFNVVEQEDGTFRVENVGYVPTWCWRHDNTVQVLSSAKYLDKAPSGMDSASYKRMKESLQETMELMGAQFAVLES